VVIRCEPRGLGERVMVFWYHFVDIAGDLKGSCVSGSKVEEMRHGMRSDLVKDGK